MVLICFVLNILDLEAHIIRRAGAKPQTGHFSVVLRTWRRGCQTKKFQLEDPNLKILARILT
jgi:hypothetical protein